MQCTLIVNPAAGGYNNRILGDVVSTLSRGGLVPRVYVTRDPAEAEAAVREAGEQGGRELVITCGGDGTVNAVVNAMAPGSTLAVIPMGTVNVLAREIKVRTVRRALEKIMAGHTRPLTVGQVETEEGTRIFTLMAGVGIDGKVVKNVRPEEKSLLGKGAYALSLVRCLHDLDDSPLEVRYDGKVVSCDSIIVCNSSLYGGDIKMARRVNVFSPELEAIYIRNNNRLEYLETASRLLLDRDNSNAFVAEAIEIKGEKPLQVDGDFLGHSPARIRALPGYLNLIC